MNSCYRSEKLTELRAQADKLLKTKNELLLKLADINNSIQAVNVEYSKYSPINYVPNEILAMIFTWNFRQIHFQGLLPLPVAISHVNQHWRNLALNTASLWSYIWLTGRQTRLCVETFIQRSQSRSLNIVMNCQRTGDKLWEIFSATQWKTFEMYLDLILPHVNRWESFALFTHHEHVITAVSDRLHDRSAPRLKYLQLYQSDKWEGSGSLRSLNLETPAILHLRTTNILFPYATSFTTGLMELFISFPSTTHTLTTHTLTYAELAGICSASPRLARLTLISFKFRRPDESLPLEAPSICTLVLDNVENLASLLFHLRTPSLNRLVLSGMDSLEYSELMSAFEPGSPLSLKYATVNYLDIIGGDYPSPMSNTSIVSAFPSLLHLSVRDTDAAPFLRLLMNGATETDDGFVYNMGTRCIWPHLRAITVTELDEDDHNLLLHVVLYHRWLGKPLAKVLLERKLLIAVGVLNSLKDLNVLQPCSFPEEPFDDASSLGFFGPDPLLRIPPRNAWKVYNHSSQVVTVSMAC